MGGKGSCEQPSRFRTVPAGDGEHHSRSRPRLGAAARVVVIRDARERLTLASSIRIDGSAD